MPEGCLHRRAAMRGLVFGLFVVLVQPAGWSQQPQPGGVPEIKGTVSGVETKGRNTTIKFTNDEGNAFDIAVTPRLEIEVRAKGDDGFLAPGVLVKIDAIQSNKLFFGSKFEVYPQFSGKSPPARAVKAPPKPGQSQNLHLVTGEIVRLEDKGDTKYDRLFLKVSGNNELMVYVEPSHSVNVVLTDPESLEAGQEASVVGRIAGPRLQAAKISVDTGKTLKGEEFLESLVRKR